MAPTSTYSTEAWVSFFGMVERGEFVEAVVGNFGDSDVGFARVGEGAFGEADFGEDSEVERSCRLAADR